MTATNAAKSRYTPQERLVQALNDNMALALILSDWLDKDDVRQEFLSRQMVYNSDRIQRALEAWQQELAADGAVEEMAA